MLAQQKAPSSKKKGAVPMFLAVAPVCSSCFKESAHGDEFFVQCGYSRMMALQEVAIALIHHAGVAMAQDVGDGVGVSHGCQILRRGKVADLVELKGFDPQFATGPCDGAFETGVGFSRPWAWKEKGLVGVPIGHQFQQFLSKELWHRDSQDIVPRFGRSVGDGRSFDDWTLNLPFLHSRQVTPALGGVEGHQQKGAVGFGGSRH